MMPFRDRQIVVHARAKYYWLCWLHYSNALFVTRPRQRAIFAAFSWSLRECGCVWTGDGGARAGGGGGGGVGAGGARRAGRMKLGRQIGRFLASKCGYATFHDRFGAPEKAAEERRAQAASSGLGKCQRCPLRPRPRCCRPAFARHKRVALLPTPALMPASAPTLRPRKRAGARNLAFRRGREAMTPPAPPPPPPPRSTQH